MNQELKYPTHQEVITALEATAPTGWVVSNEYHFIGVNHQALTQNQFIAVGNVDGYYGFNDEDADTIWGDMENITDPAEIANEFWYQLEEFYPKLFKEQN